MQEALQCYGQVLLLPSAATDFSVTNNGWRFTYTYQGTSTGRSGLPKPEGRQDIAPAHRPQELLGPFFIVKTPYNLTESSASLALEIRDLAPNTERELHRHGPRNGGFGREHLHNGSFRRDGLPGLQGTTCRGVLFT